MSDPNFVILYVNDPTISAVFYADLLGRQPVESSPAFVLFALQSGVMLGLWSKNDVKPTVLAPNGCGELAFTMPDKNSVNAQHDEWKKRGITITQSPVNMDFGYTFLALDSDGNRLRVFAPTAA